MEDDINARRTNTNKNRAVEQDAHNWDEHGQERWWQVDYPQDNDNLNQAHQVLPKDAWECLSKIEDTKMDLYEVQETIKKHITIIKKTIVKPLNFDVIVKIPKGNAEDKKHGRYEDEKEN